MLTATSEYALRAMICLAEHGGKRPVPSARVADLADVPRKYLSRILADLVRAGVLEASPGKNGGFRMMRPAEQILLHEVLGPFEPLLWKQRPCPFGQKTCNDEDACPGHEHWRKVRDAYHVFLQETSVYDIMQTGEARKAPRKRDE